MRTREYHRHQTQRMLSKVRDMVKHRFHLRGEDAERVCRKFQKQRKPCSCRMCRNPREWEGDSIADRRKLQAAD